jgi:hypothetical protein
MDLPEVTGIMYKNKKIPAKARLKQGLIFSPVFY